MILTESLIDSHFLQSHLNFELIFIWFFGVEEIANSSNSRPVFIFQVKRKSRSSIGYDTDFDEWELIIHILHGTHCKGHRIASN